MARGVRSNLSLARRIASSSIKSELPPLFAFFLEPLRRLFRFRDPDAPLFDALEWEVEESFLGFEFELTFSSNERGFMNPREAIHAVAWRIDCIHSHAEVGESAITKSQRFSNEV